METLSERSLIDTINAINLFKKETEKISVVPEMILIPPEVVGFLSEKGYDTEEKIMDLIKEITH